LQENNKFVKCKCIKEINELYGGHPSHVILFHHDLWINPDANIN